jgi:hypothetical protein
MFSTKTKQKQNKNKTKTKQKQKKKKKKKKFIEKLLMECFQDGFKRLKEHLELSENLIFVALGIDSADDLAIKQTDDGIQVILVFTEARLDSFFAIIGALN